MIDNAAVIMAQGVSIASERKEGVDDNMTASHLAFLSCIIWKTAGVSM